MFSFMKLAAHQPCMNLTSYCKRLQSLAKFIAQKFWCNHNKHLGRAMDQAVSRRPLTAEARILSWGSVHVGFVVVKVAQGQVFPPEYFGFPL
jgi:hypothetical protein